MIQQSLRLETTLRQREEPKEGTDCWLVLQVLKDLKSHHIQDICASCKPGAVNWACRSRISNLRDMGYNIINLREKSQNTLNLPIPQGIVEQYGKKDKEGIYQLIQAMG